ncbi:uncharacterized protein DKFZp434B061-like [Orbicella faveolata]|uniref:uncharacterized protein DKFZp434B061-like n=1 Tax=Orbicella faveolata TaxID=48498 RepID=UPI0009E3CBFF|nr:uncharacterized protein DKFZp434B061-like [Orbicella faveolata]
MNGMYLKASVISLESAPIIARVADWISCASVAIFVICSLFFFKYVLNREVAVLQEENSHLKRLLASSSSRPGTPHNYRNSPGAAPMKRGHTPSPTGSQCSASPYGRITPNSSQKENKASNQWQNQLSRTASGPTRLSVRTPPCNGFMGTIRKTPSPNKQPLSRPGSAGGTPGTVLRSHLQGMHLSRTANTPGSYEAATPSGLGATGVSYSPMSSPAMLLTNRSSTPGNSGLSNRSQYTTPSSSQGATQISSTPHQTDCPSRTYNIESIVCRFVPCNLVKTIQGSTVR